MSSGYEFSYLSLTVTVEYLRLAFYHGYFASWVLLIADGVTCKHFKPAQQSEKQPTGKASYAGRRRPRKAGINRQVPLTTAAHSVSE